METELEKTKKLMQKEMSDNKLFQDENERLKAHIDSELISINGHLTDSQRHYEAKWRGLFHAMHFYKDFYHKYLDLMLSNTANKSPEYQNLDKYREQNNAFELLLKDPEKMIREQRRKNEEDGRLLNVSILDLKDEGNFEERGIINEPERENFKNYLLNLAKDVNSLCRNEKGGLLPVVKFKKSMSNPIEYQSEGKRSLIFESPLPQSRKPVQNEKKQGKFALKSPAFGLNANNSIEDLGLESPEQIIFHTNYEEEEM